MTCAQPRSTGCSLLAPKPFLRSYPPLAPYRLGSRLPAKILRIGKRSSAADAPRSGAVRREKQQSEA